MAVNIGTSEDNLLYLTMKFWWCYYQRTFNISHHITMFAGFYFSIPSQDFTYFIPLSVVLSEQIIYWCLLDIIIGGIWDIVLYNIIYCMLQPYFRILSWGWLQIIYLSIMHFPISNIISVSNDWFSASCICSSSCPRIG
jgi:hypothetical protein